MAHSGHAFEFFRRRHVIVAALKKRNTRLVHREGPISGDAHLNAAFVIGLNNEMPLEGLKLRGDSRPGLLDRERNERLAPTPWGELAARRARARRILALRRYWFRLAPIRRGRADSSRDWGMRALQDGERGFQPDGMRSGRIPEQIV